ncbi:hypothetical protein AB3Y40_15565 [Yoonia sp. R2331]|uniref:hypothetical protein n=1 Tax=Yoonia sp. R2331 TaxID=3237238 RepID=UPI0034E4BF87
MTLIQGPFRWAIPFVLISALLHLIAPVISGFAVPSLMLFVIGLIYLACASGLSRGMRWLGYVMFFVMAVGGISALGAIWAAGPVPGWLFASIAVVNCLAFLTLFATLWRAPETV